ncbi:MAG: T9SS type A sorting domain-containing protein, partial [Sphingobacteriaceae bacterium]|nr:T9SS type A sorting domain-containing protein [Cytophagaceae bacterium]
GWQLPHIGSGTNDGQVITSPIQITWVINKTGAALSYVPPGGGTSTVADGRADVWVDSRLAFDDIAAVTSSQNLAQFKFIFDAGQGVLFIDDLLIRDVSGSLPVELTLFRVTPTETGAVHIQWTTAREIDSRYFAVERSADALRYVEIARRTAAGTTQEPQRYEVLDAEPLSGTGYYRLRQVDLDGSDHLTRPQASTRTLPEGPPSIFPNPSNGAVATLRIVDADRAEVRLFDATGRNYPCRFVAATDQSGQVFAEVPLAPGLYLLRVQTPNGLNTLRWVRR